MSDITTYITTLTEGPISQKRKAMRALAERAFDPESRIAVPALRRELDDADPLLLGSPHQRMLLRIAAAEALACIGEAVDEAAHVLIDALAEQQRFVRLTAIQAFGFAGAALRPWTAALAPMINADDLTTSQAAIAAVRLAGTTSEAVANGLVRRLADPDLGAAALQTLIALQHRAGLLAAFMRGPGQQAQLALESLLKLGPLEKDLITVVVALEAYTSFKRTRYLKWLSPWIDEATFTRLAEAIDSADDQTGLALVSFLSSIAIRHVAPNRSVLLGPLLRLLRRLHPANIRWFDPRILESALEEAPLEECVALTDDERPVLRRLGYAALGRHANHFVVAKLVRGLDDPDLGVRQATLTALRTAGVAARPFLLARLVDPELRCTALEALLSLAPEAPETRAALREEISRGFMSNFTLKRLRTWANGPLADLLADELLEVAYGASAEERYRAVVRLGVVPSPTVLAALESWLADGDPEHRFGAEQALSIAAENAPDVIRAAGIFDRIPISPALAYAHWQLTGRLDTAVPLLLQGGPVLDLKYDEVSGGFRLTDVENYAPPSINQLAEMVSRSDEARMRVAAAACTGDLYPRLTACRALVIAGAPLSSEHIRHLGAVLEWAAARGRDDPFTDDPLDFSWRTGNFDGLERLWIEASAVAAAMLAESGRACKVLDSVCASIEHRSGQSSYFREGDALRWHGLQLAASMGPGAAALVPSVVALLDDAEARAAAVTTLVAILPELASFEPGLRAALDVDDVRRRLLPLLQDPNRLAPVVRSLARFQILKSG